MKKLLFSTFMALLIAFIFGCAENKAEDFLLYQTNAMEIDADFCIGAANYSGSISLGSGVVGTLFGRDMSLGFTSPSTLSELTVGRMGGQEYLTCGSCNIDAGTGEFLNMLDVCRLFCIENAAVQSTDQVDLDGAKCKFVKLVNDYGSYSIYLSNESGLPWRIESTTALTQIIVDINEIKIAESVG